MFDGGNIPCKFGTSHHIVEGTVEKVGELDERSERGGKSLVLPIAKTGAENMDFFGELGNSEIVAFPIFLYDFIERIHIICHFFLCYAAQKPPMRDSLNRI